MPIELDFVAVSAPAGVERFYPPELYNTDDPQLVLTTAFIRIWEAMRHQLGTDKLSAQTVKLVGSRQLDTLRDIEKAKGIADRSGLGTPTS